MDKTHPFSAKRPLIQHAKIPLAIVAVVALFFWWQWRRMYPYGREHCCDKQLCIALLQYAEEHGGKFPTGGATPEASLSLLYPKYLHANVLRGKTYPEAPAASLLDSGQPLTPETCGWHYVDGDVTGEKL